MLVFKGNFAARLTTLKNKGQMIETMTRTQQWVDRNLDQLFEQFKKNPTRAGCTFEYVPTSMKGQEEMQKEKFRMWLLDIADKKITKRRKLIRKKALKSTHESLCNKRLDYHATNSIVESQIE